MTKRLLDGLNEAQQRAVIAGDGPVLVLAGPGSGKTRVLTHRVAYLIDERGIDPYNILAVTFTNKAAREMKTRLEVLLGSGRAEALTVGTFHSICARLLRRDIHHLGRERDFAIYDSDDQQRVMKRVLRDLDLDEKKNSPRAIHGAISRAKNELIGPDEYARHARGYFDEVVTRCYRRYEELLRESNGLDFDDLLFITVQLFEQHPEVLERYQKRYRYMLADEYQDTNRAQYVLLKQLAALHRNIFVVGDEDQSIYMFRGADIRNIRSFEDDYPDAQIVMLQRNYRSTQSILDVAQAVINRSAQRRHPKQLETTNGVGTKVQLLEGYDQDEEAQLVAEEIGRLVAAGEARYADVAIMYRTNAQSRAIEEALIARGQRYQIVGGTRFYERKEVKDALAYLRLTQNPFDSVSLGRVLNWPGRGIGERTQDELERFASRSGVPTYVALQMVVDQDAAAAAPAFSVRARNALAGFLALLDECIAARSERDLAELMEFIFRKVGISAGLAREYDEEEAADRWNNVQELRNVATGYQNLPREAQLATFLEEVALVADIDALQEERDTVTCITLHQAKGLEYPIVFLVGLEEGLLPHARSTDDRDALDEERRLFYVGATRAKQRLYLLSASRRATYGRTALAQRSRFLGDIPEGLLKAAPRRGSATITQQASMFSQRSAIGSRRSAPAANAARSTMRSHDASGPRDVAFFAGQKVRHALFGEGIVVSSKLIENDEEVTVAFPAKGVKRLLASFANLERMDHE
ncbi:MAG TPA: UvrD-helicase domain-containing protein [Roseiflexaceae bacterium]|nr:UvrD-helicase domain-containing protein [Roseiflexaceae bacterium]HMP41425.1 UvrD-helicase domain-containing protein [Roseiflexaceae bacterium]